MDKVPTGSSGKSISGAQPKGYLDLGQYDTPGYDGFTTGFGMGKYNYELGGYFQVKNSGKEQEQITQEIFDSGYETQTSSKEGQSTIKNFLR